MTHSRIIELTHPRPRRCEHRLARHHPPQQPLRGHKKLRAYDTGVERGATAPLGANLKTRTDARTKQTLYAYDALNRLTQINPGDQLITLTWDTCTNGKGRLCQIIDGAANTLYSYDLPGRVTGKTVTVGTLARSIAYGYNSAGQLTSLTTPSGQVIAYDWAHGRVSAIRVNGNTLLTAIAYQAFGPLQGWTWGNGQAMSRHFDLAGQARDFTLGTDPKTATVDYRTLHRDAAGRITAWLPAYDAGLSMSFAYDGLDRLVAAQVGNPVSTTWNFAYDQSGNRTSTKLNAGTTTYTTPATSNRLASLSGAEARSFTYDAIGNVTGDGPSMVHTYDNSGRRVKTTIGSQVWTYAYDALGERLKKSGTTTTLYAYDEQGHLLGEYDGTGKLIQETVWLGDTPVATLRLPAGATSGSASVFYVHADHLNTPRRITRPADNKVMWQWESEPFGNTRPNENPQAQGTFVYALRFPGQVFDAETGLAYNFFRDYDSDTGRYRESDPIGLRGGINTYSYVGGNPVWNADPYGMQALPAPAIGPGAAPQIAQVGGGVAANDAVFASASRFGFGLGPVAAGIGLALWPSSAGAGSDIVPVARDIWRPDKPSSGWVCKARADCNDNIPGNCPDNPKHRQAFGGGAAQSLGAARNIAKANATSNLQCQPKHVSCKCTNSKGDLYDGGC